MKWVLVGRDAETRDVATVLDVTANEPTALIIGGEPGIGKTALWLDTLERARKQGIRILVARTSPAESVLAYAALADLLVGVEQELWADLPPPQRHGLASALLRGDEAALPAVDQRAVGAGFLAVLSRLAFQSPVLVAIDDLQWLDGSSAAAVAFVARRLPGRVAILCTERSDAGVTSSSWLQLSQPYAVRRIRLEPLSVSELHDVLIALLGRPLPRPRLLRIHQISGGNPFYASELAREIDQRGAAAELRLPDSLLEVTRSRISRVTGGADDALLAIACVADATIGAVAQALKLAPQRLVALLEEAETQGIIAIEGNRIRFTHPLLAHAVHLSATAPQRRSMHRRLAEVVSEPELRARHLALSDPSGEPATLDALDAAAAIARGRGAPAAAAELLQLAIGLGGATARRRIGLAECLFDAGDPNLASDSLEAAIAEMSPGPERSDALQHLALVRLYTDSFVEAADLARRALEDCPESYSELRVEIMVGLAFAEVNAGATDEALMIIDDAVATAERLPSSGSLAQALSMRAMLQFMIGNGVDPAILERICLLEMPNTPLPVPFRPNVHRALLLAWTGELNDGREALGKVGEQCIALGEEGEMMFIAFHLTLFDIWRGDLGQASITADDALVRARQLGGDASLFIGLTVRAAVASYEGRIDDARRDLADAVAAAGRSGSVRLMEWPISTQGFLELSLGNHAEALSALEPLLPMLQIAPDSSEIISATFVPDAAEAMINLGRHDDAEQLVEVLERNGARLDRAWMLAVGARCRALLTAARGDVASGVAIAHDALAHHDRLDMPFERGRTLLVLGRLERRLRHWRPATDALTEALAIFKDAGAPLWVEQARAELDRGTAGRRRSPGLTPAERRVAELAASGMSNQDIARTLFVARKTVEVNLSRIYQKLGIRSRVELYHMMHNPGLGTPVPDAATHEPEP